MSDENETHPIQISVGFNEKMQRWDCAMFVGNFATKNAAQEYATRIKEVLEGEANATFDGRA